MHEVNQIKKAWRADSLKIALVYPNRYSAMAGLTIQTLYHLWNAFPEVICERFFMPSRELGDDTAQWRSQNSKDNVNSFYPKRRSLESQMPLSSFDIIAFTLCFELDYPNILWFLHNAGIPWFRDERVLNEPNSKDQDEDLEESEYPLVICGGPAVRSNPVLLEPFFDALFIGELEPVNAAFISTLLTVKRNFLIETDRSIYSLYSKGLKEIPGFWVPNQDSPIPEKPIKKVYAEDLDSHLFPVAQVCPIFEKSEENLFPFGDAFYLEVNRGCPHSCRFCITGAQTKPFRNRSLASLKDILIKGRELTPFKRVVLIGSAVQEHPDFLKLCQFLVDNKIEFSIPSIRVEALTKDMVDIFAKSGMKTITIAPETGSDRLRKKIGKSITNLAILNGVRLCFDAGLPNIKAYFLYGLPEESDDDVLAISALSREIADLGYGKQAVRISLNPFIPKAQTPFEACIDNYLTPNMPLLNRRFEMILKHLKGNRQIKLESLSLEEAFIETCFSLGDQGFSDLIVDFYNIGGSAANWHRYVKKSKDWQQKINTYYKNLQSANFGERPWNRVVETNSIDFLAKEYNRTLDG
jgi:radical SAM superfamily enzyme YgiQ (UPF0313 family)